MTHDELRNLIIAVNSIRDGAQAISCLIGVESDSKYRGIEMASTNIVYSELLTNIGRDLHEAKKTITKSDERRSSKWENTKETP